MCVFELLDRFDVTAACDLTIWEHYNLASVDLQRHNIKYLSFLSLNAVDNNTHVREVDTSRSVFFIFHFSKYKIMSEPLKTITDHCIRAEQSARVYHGRPMLIWKIIRNLSLTHTHILCVTFHWSRGKHKRFFFLLHFHFTICFFLLKESGGARAWKSHFHRFPAPYIRALCGLVFCCCCCFFQYAPRIIL